MVHPVKNMCDNSELQKVTKHYHSLDLVAKIESSLARHQRSISSLTLNDLATFDELHIGGKAASRRLANKAGLEPGKLILDVGSGIGGPARMLANEFGLQVIGLDLACSFCELANKLSKAVRIDNNLGFINGNALEMPFKENTIDAVWSQHCAMNIAEKTKLYSEFKRILKPKGKLLIHDVIAGDQQPVIFPVPWASSKDFSFLESSASLKKILVDSGFDIPLWEDITEQAFAWYDTFKKTKPSAETPILSQKLVLGDGLKIMAKNAKMNLQQNRVKIIEAICSPRKNA